jgi:peroxiredoxin Q/BCP
VDGHPRACLMRSTFVIDKQGVVRHILQDVNPRAHVDEVLKVCKELNGKRAN